MNVAARARVKRTKGAVARVGKESKRRGKKESRRDGRRTDREIRDHPPPTCTNTTLKTFRSTFTERCGYTDTTPATDDGTACILLLLYICVPFELPRAAVDVSIDEARVHHRETESWLCLYLLLIFHLLLLSLLLLLLL